MLAVCAFSATNDPEASKLNIRMARFPPADFNWLAFPGNNMPVEPLKLSLTYPDVQKRLIDFLYVC